jgi:hypothetical protein
MAWSSFVRSAASCAFNALMTAASSASWLESAWIAALIAASGVSNDPTLPIGPLNYHSFGSGS